MTLDLGAASDRRSAKENFLLHALGVDDGVTYPRFHRRPLPGPAGWRLTRDTWSPSKEISNVSPWLAQYLQAGASREGVRSAGGVPRANGIRVRLVPAPAAPPPHTLRVLLSPAPLLSVAGGL